MRNNAELYKELEKFIPNHKLGFKILKDGQLTNIFPSHEILIKKIKEHRQKLNEHGKIRGLDNQYNLMYDNVYSIMGKRGSGKTSALFTLKKKIEMEFPKDWVLPVIMPELIPEKADIIGWILAILDEVVTEVEEKLQNNSNIRRDSAYFRDCKFVVNNELRQTYERVKDLHFSKNLEHYKKESLAVATGNSQIQTLNGFEFAKAFSKFWDALVDAIAKAESDSKEENPLIYLMFDDVDLTPNRIMELLSTIIKYLAHPNLIVIITAEESLFYDVVYKQLSKELDTESMKKTAQLYVDKVMPQSSRFYLERFDDCRKKSSFLQTAVTEDKKIEEKNLEQILREQVNCYIQSRTGNKIDNEYDNFLYYQGDKNQFLKIYFLFWGNTSRQLVNESLIVSDTISRLIKIHETASSSPQQYDKEEYAEKVYECIQGFIRNSIKSNLHLRDMIDDVEQFVYELCSRNKTRWAIFIDYETLEKFYFEKMCGDISEEDQKKLLENIIALFVLLFFAENLLLIDDKVDDEWSVTTERKYVHGAKYLVTILDSLLPDTVSLIKNSRTYDAVAEVLYNYGSILSNPNRLKKFSICQYLDVKDYLYPLYSRETKTEIDMNELYKWNIENPRWFATMTKMVYFMASGVYSLNERTIRIFQWRNKIKVCDSYLSSMANMGMDEIRKQLADCYQYPKEEKTKLSYHMYTTLNHRVKVIEKVEEKLDARKALYCLENIKDDFMDIIRADSNVQEKVESNKISSYEEFFRISCFLTVVQKDMWGYGAWTRNVVRSELRRVQNELIQNYSLLSNYYVVDNSEMSFQLRQLLDIDLSFEIREIVEFLLKELNYAKVIEIPIANRLIELLNKRIKEDEVHYPYSDARRVKICRNIIIKNLRVTFWGTEEKKCGIDIVVQHEALLHLQALYLDLMLDEMKDMLQTQGIASESFYSKYRDAIFDVLKVSEYLNMGILRRGDSRPEVYLGRYVREILKEAVDEYFVEQRLIVREEERGAIYE